MVNLPQPEQRLVTVQYLRAIAALMVVAHHVRAPVDWLWNPLEHNEFLASGVDIFFNISGFVMVVAAADDTARRFLIKRVIRVVPLYWVVTILLLAKNAYYTPGPVAAAEWLEVIQSLLFFPHYSLSNPERVWPYLVPGWTLNYEMFFYLIFAVGLVLRRPLVFTSVMLVLLVVIGVMFHPGGAVAGTYTSWQLLEFLTGAWIGYLYKRGSLQHVKLAIAAPLGFLALFLCGSEDSGALCSLVASAAILLGTVALANHVPHWRPGALLGDASYSIYLVHTVFGLRLARRLAEQIPIHGPIQFVSTIALALAICSIVGVIFHLVVEKPSLRFLRTRLLQTPAAGRLTLPEQVRGA